MNQYPERQVSRQCWKTYNDGVNCPWATKGASAAAVTAAGGDPTSCDYYLESANGCQVHGMAPYFGAQQADPQGVVIKDDSTGFLGFGRNTVTATSIISDTVWGLALPEIWCNSGGNPLFAFLATALMVDYRDESGYADSLGILGAGPLGGFTAVDGRHERGRLPIRGRADGRWLPLAGSQGRRQSERHEVPARHGAALRHRQRSGESGHGLFLARPRDAAGLGAERLRGGHGGVRDPHRQVHHDPAQHSRPAPDDGPDRLRDVGLDLGPERQPHGGQGPDQSVLDRRQHAAARDGLVWRPVHRLEPCRRHRPGLGGSARHVRAAVADRRAMAAARPRSRPPRWRPSSAPASRRSSSFRESSAARSRFATGSPRCSTAAWASTPGSSAS